MLAKVPPKRNDARSSFKLLAEYIARAEKGCVGAEDQAALGEQAVALETNCLSLATAAAEMTAAADMNARVKDPVYHVILSWRAGEHPSDAQMFEAGCAAMKAVGMADHQYVFGAHRDTDNHHLHVMVNRVHPETEHAVYPDRDFYKLDRCMRELELSQGWAHDNGPYAVHQRDGVAVVDWASTDKKTTEKQPSKARDMEVAGQESLYSYARGEPRQAAAALLKDRRTIWQDLHGALAKHGLALREKGQGLAVYAKDQPDQTPIKASDVHEGLGKGKLVKRLGAYEPPIHAIEVEEAQQRYSKHREPVLLAKRADRQEVRREPMQREQVRESRALAREDLRSRYDAWLATQKQALQKERASARRAEQLRRRDLIDHHKARREQIRSSGLSVPVKKAFYSVAAMDAVKAREALRDELAQQREPGRRVQSFKEWAVDQAQDGDAAAISQLPGWAYADRRQAKDLERWLQASEPPNGITTAWADEDTEPLSPVRLDRLALLDALKYRVDRHTGDVHYQSNDREVFTDCGQHVSFSTDGASDAEALAAGLMLARQKFGLVLTLTGSEQFKEDTIQVMAARRMDVRLSDPALEARRVVLMGGELDPSDAPLHPGEQ